MNYPNYINLDKFSTGSVGVSTEGLNKTENKKKYDRRKNRKCDVKTRS